MTNDKAARIIEFAWTCGSPACEESMDRLVHETGWTEAQIREYLKMWDDSFFNGEKVDWRNVGGLE